MPVLPRVGGRRRLREHRWHIRDFVRGLLAGAETYAKNLEDAVNNDVFGAPFYVVDGAEKFWGQDRLSDLDAFLAGDL